MISFTQVVPDVLQNHFLLAVVALLSSWCVVEILWSARAGVRESRPAKMALATAVVFLSFSYWAEILDVLDVEDCQDLRRITSPALFLAIIWTARSGRLFWKREAAALGGFTRRRASGG